MLYVPRIIMITPCVVNRSPQPTLPANQSPPVKPIWHSLVSSGLYNVLKFLYICVYYY